MLLQFALICSILEFEGALRKDIFLNFDGFFTEFCSEVKSAENDNFAGNQNGTEKLEQKLERKKLERKL